MTGKEIYEVGDKVEFYFGKEKCRGTIKELKPYERCEIIDDDYIYYETDLSNIKKIVEKPINDELTKYKRAFEILKEILSLNKDKSIDGKVDFYTLYFTGQFPYEIYKRLEKEEYELLEELMRDEEDAKD